MALIDSYSRKITYMRVSITDRCNLRCTYCQPLNGVRWIEHGDILRFEEILRIVRVAAKKGLTKIRVTGGEPLVRKGTVGFIKELRGIGGILDIAMTTNGVFLKEYAEDLYEAGLRRLNISFDSLIPEKFQRMTRGNVYWRVWNGIEEAERIGFSPIKLNVVLQRGVNDDEVIEFVKMTLTRSVHIRFIEYMPVSELEEWRERYMPVEEIKERIERELGGFHEVGSLNGNHGPAELYRLEGGVGYIGFIHAISKHFCNECNRIRLTADGKIRPCLFSELEVDFRDALRRGCSDEEIGELLEQVLEIKPEGHKLNKYMKSRMLDSMVNIGG